MRKLIMTCVAALAFATASGCAVRAHAHFRPPMPPPPPPGPMEMHPRHGMVWVPGHYEWNGYRHRWVNGYWVRRGRW